jgi:regulator of protease activity HflC (stomatin/prohibitin superfamily)
MNPFIIILLVFGLFILLRRSLRLNNITAVVVERFGRNLRSITNSVNLTQVTQGRQS